MGDIDAYRRMNSNVPCFGCQFAPKTSKCHRLSSNDNQCWLIYRRSFTIGYSLYCIIHTDRHKVNFDGKNEPRWLIYRPSTLTG